MKGREHKADLNVNGKILLKSVFERKTNVVLDGVYTSTLYSGGSGVQTSARRPSLE
jgi:hypothetical protein